MPDHISVYPLTLEEGTPLDVAVGTGLVPEPDPDLAAELMVLAEEYLAVEGIERYEMANYARPGHESRHNIAYWTGRTYVGLGPAAHGMLDAETAASALGVREPGKVRARVANVARSRGVGVGRGSRDRVAGRSREPRAKTRCSACDWCGGSTMRSRTMAGVEEVLAELAGAGSRRDTMRTGGGRRDAVGSSATRCFRRCGAASGVAPPVPVGAGTRYNRVLVR